MKTKKSFKRNQNESFAEQSPMQKKLYPVVKIATASPNELIEAGIHNNFVSVDREVFKKTKEEKMKAKLAKSLNKNTTRSVTI